MKVRPSVKPMCDKCKVIKRNGKVMVICPKYPNHMCDKCKVIKRNGKVMVICPKYPNHKQRQG